MNEIKKSLSNDKITNIYIDWFVTNEEFTKLVTKKFTISIVNFDNTIQFETRIPDYIYNECIKQYPDIYDKKFIENRITEEIKKYGTIQNLKNIKPKSKILRSPTLELIKGELETLSNMLITLNTFEEKNGEKVIFIYFEGSTSQKRNKHYGANMGILNSIQFQYFIGYHFNGMVREHLTDNDILVEKYSAFYKCVGVDKWKERELKPLHRTEKEKETLKQEYLIIPWSEEREQYLKDIQTNFSTMIDKLNEFLKDLTEVKLDNLIENHPVQKLLLN